MASEPENPSQAGQGPFLTPQKPVLTPREQKLVAERRRLAEALRENLKRRKMQARVRRQSAIEEADLDENPDSEPKL